MFIRVFPYRFRFAFIVVLDLNIKLIKLRTPWQRANMRDKQSNVLDLGLASSVIGKENGVKTRDSNASTTVRGCAAAKNSKLGLQHKGG